jgi:hypothetical protein
MMNIQGLLVLLLVVVVAANVISIILWFWLTFLVKSSGNYIGSQTAYNYTKLLFSTMMESRFNPTPKMVALSNPDRDPVMRAVRSSGQFGVIEWVASWVRVVPGNFVPRLV